MELCGPLRSLRLNKKAGLRELIRSINGKMGKLFLGQTPSPDYSLNHAKEASALQFEPRKSPGLDSDDFGLEV